jgi:hypothetical protein
MSESHVQEPGDKVLFVNAHGYRKNVGKTGAWAVENAIVVGQDEYWGNGANFQSEEQMNQLMVDAFNVGPTKISMCDFIANGGGLTNRAYFLNVPKIGMNMIDHSN